MYGGGGGGTTVIHMLQWPHGNLRMLMSRHQHVLSSFAYGHLTNAALVYHSKLTKKKKKKKKIPDTCSLSIPCFLFQLFESFSKINMSNYC